MIVSDVNKSSMAKAEAYAEFAKAAGWEPVIGVEGDLITCTTTRGNESIVIHWQGARFVEDARYTNGSQNLALRNVSHARSKMGESADVAARAATTSTIRKARGRKAASHPDDENAVAVAKSRLPFDAKTSMDEDVLRALAGKTIVWRNAKTRELEQAKVAINPGEKLMKIDIKGDRRVFTFVSMKGPFRSIYLDSILEVK